MFLGAEKSCDSVQIPDRKYHDDRAHRRRVLLLHSCKQISALRYLKEILPGSNNADFICFC